LLASIVLGLLLAAPCCAVMTGLASLRAGPARVPAGAAGHDPDRPAAVNLVLNRCSATTGAYQATILDLAARGFLAATEVPGGLWLTRADPGPGGPVLAGYEQQVLRDVRARLAGTGGAPFPALADACTADPRGIWEPFTQMLMAEARRTGLCRPVLPATARTAAEGAVGAGAIALAAFLIAAARPVAGMASPGVAVLAGVVAFVLGLLVLCRHHRLTAAGSALAAAWRREAWADAPAMSLQRRAYAVAAGVPSVLSGLAVTAGRRARRPRLPASGSKQRPAQAWSSFTGTWRPVAIGPDFAAPPGLGSILAVVAGAVWCGMVAFILTVPFPTGPWALIPLAAAALFGLLALQMFARWSARPGPSTFDGQVIARWQQETAQGEDRVTVDYIAVDDGQRGWTFGGYPVCSQVALGDLLRVTVYPRSGKIGVEVTSSPRAESATEEPAGPAAPSRAQLLTADEAAALLGPVASTMPLGTAGGRGVIHRGPGRRSLIVVVASGRLADINAGHARRHGTPAWDVGEEAWTLAHGRMVVVRVGDEVAKVQLSGPARPEDPERLRALAAALARRLAAAPA
jgi:hypothetical protein